MTIRRLHAKFNKYRWKMAQIWRTILFVRFRVSALPHFIGPLWTWTTRSIYYTMVRPDSTENIELRGKLHSKVKHNPTHQIMDGIPLHRRSHNAWMISIKRVARDLMKPHLSVAIGGRVHSAYRSAIYASIYLYCVLEFTLNTPVWPNWAVVSDARYFFRIPLWGSTRKSIHILHYKVVISVSHK